MDGLVYSYYAVIFSSIVFIFLCIDNNNYLLRDFTVVKVEELSLTQILQFHSIANNFVFHIFNFYQNLSRFPNLSILITNTIFKFPVLKQIAINMPIKLIS
jgi:hypothetical protein